MERNERPERGERGERASRDRYRDEATPSWANAEVKGALEDDDTFGSSSGGGGEGEFVLGAVLDREADAKIMRDMGWGNMFKASENLEKQAAAEREVSDGGRTCIGLWTFFLAPRRQSAHFVLCDAVLFCVVHFLFSVQEIRRAMRAQEEEEEEQQGRGGNYDFEVLPAEHPLMLAKAAAAGAASSGPAAGSGAQVAAVLANMPVSDDDELAKLDELLAAKAAKAAAAKQAASGQGLGSVPEESAARPAAVGQWSSSSSSVKPAESSPPASSPETSGTSKFASRFGFGLQGQCTAGCSHSERCMCQTALLHSVCHETHCCIHLYWSSLRFLFAEEHGSDPWSSPPTGGAGGASVAAPKSSGWGFQLESGAPQPDASMQHKFAATPNTIQRAALPPHLQQQQQQQQQYQQPPQQQQQYQQQAEPVYRPVAVNDIFKMFETQQAQVSEQMEARSTCSPSSVAGRLVSPH